MKRFSIEKFNKMSAQLAATWTKEDDRRISKATGILIRARQQMGIPRSEETKRKISIALMGRKPSASTCAKISASLKTFYAAAKKPKSSGSRSRAKPR